MSASEAIAGTGSGSVKGWCPGALKPMLTGDGLIVRVRPRGGMLTLTQMSALGQIARAYGNGHIDLTRRANLQVRGVCDEVLPRVWGALLDCGLIDASAEAEAVRNVLVSPLAGLDPTELCDVRPIAAALEQELERNQALWALPGKFGFVVDGGGALLPLDEERADIRIKASRTGSGDAAIAVGIDSAGETEWLALVEQRSAHAAAVDVAIAFLTVSRGQQRARMRDLGAGTIAQLKRLLPLNPQSLSQLRFDPPSSALSSSDLIGAISAQGRMIAMGLAVPFGRIEADWLEVFAAEARDLGVHELRLSPWRTLYVPVGSERDSKTLIEAAIACGFITVPRHPLMAIDACPGKPSCVSGFIETRSIAHALAEAMPMAGISSVHVSGCGKGCARSKSADVVLVGTPAGIGVIRNGTASDALYTIVALDDVARLPALVKSGA
jgi:precorrin-3B synthase